MNVGQLIAGLARVAALAALLAAASAQAAVAAGTGYSRPATYGVGQAKDLTVRMSDGVVLAADVYYPTDPATGLPARGRFPVVLAQTPYGKRSATTTESYVENGGDGYFPYLVRRGYINAIADVRGTGSSGGDFGLFSARDARDGGELVRWAARLPHSNGRVGAAGYSYVGLNQIFTAARIGPRSPLKAIVPSAAGFDLYRDLAFGGGIPNAVFAAGWSGLRSGMVTAPPDDPSQDPFAIVMNPANRAQGLANLDAALYTEVEEGGPRAYDSSFWRERAPSRYLARVVANGIPALMISGWFDVYQRGVLLNYAAFQNAWARQHPRGAGLRRRPRLFGPMAPRQIPTPRYQLVDGPWFHNPAGLGEWIQQIHLEWFDRWLKGRRTALTRTRRPLHAYELGAGRWIDAGAYPLAPTRVRTLWLDGGPSGTAPASLNDGVLAARRPRDAAGADRIAWSDAASPCNRHPDQWSTGFGAYVSAFAGMPLNACANDDSSTQAGALAYTTEPFARDTTLAGPITAAVYLSSAARDSELVATLEDIRPDGTSYPLTTGALLGSLRALDAGASWRVGGRTILPAHPYTAASRRDLASGRVERQDIEVYPVFARLGKGHRLRLTLATAVSHLQPTAAQLPGLAGGTYEVQRNAGRASFVNLPVAAPGRLRTSGRRWGECNAQC